MCRPQDFMENPEIISLSNKLKQNKIPEGIPQNNRYKKGGWKHEPLFSRFAFSRYLFPASDYRESLNAEIAFFTFYYCADSTNTTRFRIGWPNLSTPPPAATFSLSAEMQMCIRDRIIHRMMRRINLHTRSNQRMGAYRNISSIQESAIGIHKYICLLYTSRCV